MLELKSMFVPSPVNEPVNEPVIFESPTAELFVKLSSVVFPAFNVEVPISIFRNPLDIAPEFKVETVTSELAAVRLLKVSIADSIVASVVASSASILFNEVVSPPEKILVLPKVISPPSMVKSPLRVTSLNSVEEHDTTTFLHCASIFLPFILDFRVFFFAYKY